MKKQSVITIGNFDGIHLGHRKLLSRVLEIAKTENLTSVAISYTDHPAFTLKAHPMPRMLCPAGWKKRELLALGIEEVELLSFTAELSRTSAEDFLRNYLIPVWHPKVIVVGYDSHFGHQRKGNYHFLRSHAEDFGFQVEYIDPLMFQGKPISSSMIRELLQGGETETATELLGRPYCLVGEIGHGIAKGQDFGFPTANLILGNPHQLIPRSGIYFSKVHLGKDAFFGLTNIGSSPTVKHTGIIEIETFILDFNGDIYGQYLEVELLRYLREEMMFGSVELLIQAMRKDLATARRLIAEQYS